MAVSYTLISDSTSTTLSVTIAEPYLLTPEDENYAEVLALVTDPATDVESPQTTARLLELLGAGPATATTEAAAEPIELTERTAVSADRTQVLRDGEPITGALVDRLLATLAVALDEGLDPPVLAPAAELIEDLLDGDVDDTTAECLDAWIAAHGARITVGAQILTKALTISDPNRIGQTAYGLPVIGDGPGEEARFVVDGRGRLEGPFGIADVIVSVGDLDRVIDQGYPDGALAVEQATVVGLDSVDASAPARISPLLSASDRGGFDLVTVTGSDSVEVSLLD